MPYSVRNSALQKHGLRRERKREERMRKEERKRKGAENEKGGETEKGIGFSLFVERKGLPGPLAATCGIRV